MDPERSVVRSLLQTAGQLEQQPVNNEPEADVEEVLTEGQFLDQLRERVDQPVGVGQVDDFGADGPDAGEVALAGQTSRRVEGRVVEVMAPARRLREGVEGVRGYPEEIAR